MNLSRCVVKRDNPIKVETSPLRNAEVLKLTLAVVSYRPCSAS